MNKKGAEMTIGTIVIIVLAIAVLVFLIFGFTTGWSNLWERIGIYGGGGVNVNDVATACAGACAQQSEYNFCTLKRELITEKGSQGSYSCEQLTIINNYGIEKCSGLCSASEEGLAVAGESEW
jgi:hypothetical protein